MSGDATLDVVRTLPALPARDPDGHKGTFGTVVVVGGNAVPPRVMIGAPALSARAALRAGAGLAIVAVPAPLVASVITIAPGATALALPVDETGALRPSDAAEILDTRVTGRACIAVGPGWGTGDAQMQILARLIASDLHPLVIDADGLNVLAAMPDVQRDWRAPAVITPHPGEYRRLADALGLDGDPFDPSRRPAAAADLARRLGCVVVLKGAGTVISDGLRVAVNETGNAALATAGTGDVLTGLLAGLIAQYATGGAGESLDLFGCARIAVHAHGLAADRWRDAHGEAGLLAEELADGIPGALRAGR